MHFASNGCMLPNIVDSRINRNIQHKIAEMNTNEKNEVVVNVTAIRSLLQKGERYEDFIVSFVEFAERGFVSIDTCRTEELDNQYVVVAYSKKKCYLIKSLDTLFYKELKVPILESDIFYQRYLADLWGKS